MQPPMTIEERDTARAIQTIARELKKPAQPKEIDWEQRRYEIAKEMLAAFLSNSCQQVYEGSFAEQAKYAVRFADALINELKSQTNKPK